VSTSRLLVVDADPAVHELLRPALGRAGTVEDVYDSREALVQLKSLACDVVVAAQDRNGFDDVFQLLRKLRAVRPEARVILTGDPDPHRVINAIRARAFSYFHKPLAAGPVADMVQQALEADRWKDDIRVVSACPEWITLEIRCKFGANERATQFLREMQPDLPAGIRDDVAVAFRELLMNAIEHGGKSNPHKRVRVSLLRTSTSLIGHVQDPGAGFSLNSVPHAAISNPEDSPIRHVEVRLEQGQRPGGFGILMTRNMVDELLYNEHGNAVLFVKHLK
jgi:two-component system, OmpR family, response regulator